MKKRNLVKAMLIVACSASLTACSSSGDNTTTAEAPTTTAAPETTTTSAPEETTTAEETTEAAKEPEKQEGPVNLRIGQVQGAANGNQVFTVATAVVDDNDTIIAAYIDEYQFLDSEQIGVPNSEAFVEDGSVAAGKLLASKRENNEYYSELMKQAGSTQMISVNFDEIQGFAAGKTIAELEELAGKSSEEVLDAVSGATLVNTGNYLGVIVDAAKAAKENTAVIYEDDPSNLMLNVQEAAAHGNKCFTLAAALSDGNSIVLSYIDEFQFLDSEQIGVPNSDFFTEDGSILDGKVLSSKRVNNTYYSENMKKAGSTKEIAANFDAIQEFVNGKTILELEELVGQSLAEEEEAELEGENVADQRDQLEAEEKKETVDAVSGATLVDKMNYIAAILSAVE